jgi:hypothetical protein
MTPSDIAQFLLEEHRPSLLPQLKFMDDEAVGRSIAEALENRFPALDHETMMQGLLIAAEVEKADLAFRRRRIA